MAAQRAQRAERRVQELQGLEGREAALREAEEALDQASLSSTLCALAWAGKGTPPYSEVPTLACAHLQSKPA